MNGDSETILREKLKKHGMDNSLKNLNAVSNKRGITNLEALLFFECPETVKQLQISGANAEFQTSELSVASTIVSCINAALSQKPYLEKIHAEFKLGMLNYHVYICSE